jgi:predicted dehydrogenase
MSLGIGIVGIGKHGMRYGRHLMAGEVEGAHLVAVQRRTNARGLEAAAELGVSYLPTVEDLCLHEGIGALIIASPPDAHVDAVRMAVQAGKACLIEKPLGRTSAEAEELLAVTQAPGAPLCTVAYPLRWNAVVREVRERLPELGVLRSLWIALRHKAPEDRSWRLDPDVAGGGVALDYGTHLFDLVRWLTGAEITAVRADVGRATDAAVESHLQALLTLHGAASDGGAVRVQIEALAGASGPSGRIDAVGTLAELTGDYRHGTLRKGFGKAELDLELPPLPAPLVGLTSAFVRAVGGADEPDLPAVADGVAGLRAAEACYRSAAGGEVVKLEAAAC